MGRTRLLLVDDHVVVRAGLRLVLESEGDIQVVGEAADGVEAIERAAELSPDVILMDISMPRLNGLEAARQIRKQDSHTSILFLTMHQSEEFFFHALKVGALGYIPKSARDTELLEAVRAVRAGEAYLHPSVARTLISDYLERNRTRAALDPYERLTDREREILHLIAAGNTNRQIAETLHVSVNTIHNHRSSVMGKLGLHDRIGLLKYAIRRGIISEEIWQSSTA